MSERVWLSREEIDTILLHAAERGATSALKKVGLDDENAADNIKELRNLLSSFRTVRRVALETFVKALTTAFLAVLAAGIAYSTWRSGP